MFKYSISIFFIFLLALPLFYIEGRGGRSSGRGGAGRGAGTAAGAGRAGGSSIQRSPSLSRTASNPRSIQTTPARQPVQRQQIRTSNIQQPANLNIQRQATGTQIREGAAQRAGSWPQNSLSQKQTQLGAQQTARTASNNGALAQQFRANRPQQQQLNRQNANNIRDQYNRLNPGYQNWFNADFFNGHDFRPNYFNPGVDWWRAARWDNVNDWLGTGWAVPVYYDSLYDLYYEDPIYSSSPTVPSNSVTYEQNNYAPPIASQPQSEWLPLGVFVLSPTPEQSYQANMFLQLALNKNGEINGAYYNSSTNGVYEVIGQVDKSTQQVTLKFADYPNPTLVTALNNLTDYQTPVRLYFTNGIEQVWTLTQVQK